ncbi:MAG: tetratricopeptide repeat protein, partial [Polyangiales bacterium]
MSRACDMGAVVAYAWLSVALVACGRGGRTPEVEAPGTAGGESPSAATGQGTAGGEAASDPWSEGARMGDGLPERPQMSAAARQEVTRADQAAAAGQLERAEQALRAALRADPKAYEAAYKLGVIADRQGNESQALNAYREALKLAPDYERAAAGIIAIRLRHGSVREARDFIVNLAGKYKSNLALQALYGDVLVRAGEIDEAWRVSRAALRKNERYVPVMAVLARASEKQGRHELADAIVDQALETAENYAELHYLRALRALRDEQLQQAMKSLRRAVELRPDYVEARVLLGEQLLAGANYNEALAEFQAAAALAPRLAAVHLFLGEAFRATENWQSAKRSYERALRLERKLPQVHFNMGLMYMTAGERFPGLDKLGALRQAKAE